MHVDSTPRIWAPYHASGIDCQILLVSKLEVELELELKLGVELELELDLH